MELLQGCLVATGSAGGLLVTTIAVQSCARAVRRVVRPTAP